MNEELLFSQGYKKTGHNTYEAIDEETGMTVELEFSSKATKKESAEIENAIIDILTR